MRRSSRGSSSSNRFRRRNSSTSTASRKERRRQSMIEPPRRSRRSDSSSSTPMRSSGRYAPSGTSGALFQSTATGGVITPLEGEGERHFLPLRARLREADRPHHARDALRERAGRELGREALHVPH